MWEDGVLIKTFKKAANVFKSHSVLGEEDLTVSILSAGYLKTGYFYCLVLAVYFEAYMCSVYLAEVFDYSIFMF